MPADSLENSLFWVGGLIVLGIVPRVLLVCEQRPGGGEWPSRDGEQPSRHAAGARESGGLGEAGLDQQTQNFPVATARFGVVLNASL